MLSSCMTLKRPFLIAVAALVALLPLTPGCSSSESDARQPSTATAEARAKESGAERPKIVAFGDSLTSGYGIEKSRSYPAQLQRLLDERGVVGRPHSWTRSTIYGRRRCPCVGQDEDHPCDDDERGGRQRRAFTFGEAGFRWIAAAGLSCL